MESREFQDACSILQRVADAFNHVLGPPLQNSPEVQLYSHVPKHYLGSMSVVCNFCCARFFVTESQHCCRSGAVCLPEWRQPPDFLKALLQKEAFVNRIRAYNCTFSLGSSVFTDMTAKSGPATFKMCGRSWRLLPKEVDRGVVPAKTAQVYVLEVHEATHRRLEITSSSSHSELRSDWLIGLHMMLLSSNVLVQSFVAAHATSQPWTISLPSMEPRASSVNDSIIGCIANGGENLTRTTVIPNSEGSNLIVFDDLNPYYQPIHFVLLFPYGNSQWGLHLSRARSDNRKRKRSEPTLTCFDYLRFYIQRREAAGDVSLHHFGRLFEEWVVDVFLQAENINLKYLKNHQSKFRRENCSALRAQALSVPAHSIGSPATHLPSSFIRSGRYYRELYNDAMRIPATYGSIDYFITFTTNPSWPEILENSSFASGQNSPDMYCRVFSMKMKAMLHDIVDLGCLGVVTAYCYTVEFQNRGLPHMHLLVFVRREDKPNCPTKADSMASAQFPNAEDTIYFAAVCKHMIHGPCGILNKKHYCMKQNVCRFDYPKRLSPNTTIPPDGKLALHYFLPTATTEVSQVLHSSPGRSVDP